MSTTDRRQFLSTAAVAGAGLSLAPIGCVTFSRRGAGKRIAFNTANLVARCSNYRFELKRWGEQHQKTVAQTDPPAWKAICEDIAAAGFHAVEVWEAHAAPESLNHDKALLWKRILEDHGLQPIGYGGGLRLETLQICQWLGIPAINGGLGGKTVGEATALCREYGVRLNFENHPEKTSAEALAKIDGGNEWLGLCVDTGWFGTQGANVPDQIRLAGRLVRHAHIKDVRAAGAHDTCLLGDGIVDVAGCVAALRDVGYTGWYSWEDEPEDRNPFDSAQRNREWLEAQLARS